jgi:hypothetical protein
MQTTNLKIKTGDNVRIRSTAGEQWEGKRGTAVRKLGNLWEVNLSGTTADFAERELTRLR